VEPSALAIDFQTVLSARPRNEKAVLDALLEDARFFLATPLILAVRPQ
jgi:hypothetical protein